MGVSGMINKLKERLLFMQDDLIESCDLYCSKCNNLDIDASWNWDGKAFICSICQAPGQFVLKGQDISTATSNIWDIPVLLIGEI